MLFSIILSRFTRLSKMWLICYCRPSVCSTNPKESFFPFSGKYKNIPHWWLKHQYERHSDELKNRKISKKSPVKFTGNSFVKSIYRDFTLDPRFFFSISVFFSKMWKIKKIGPPDFFFRFLIFFWKSVIFNKKIWYTHIFFVRSWKNPMFSIKEIRC